VDDTESYFRDEVVLSTFSNASEQMSSLPDEAVEEFECNSTIPLPPDPPSGGDRGGCR